LSRIIDVPDNFENWGEAFAWLRERVVELGKAQPSGSVVDSTNSLRLLCEVVGVRTTQIEEAVRRGKDTHQ